MKCIVALALVCLVGSAMAQSRSLLEGETDLVALASSALLESGTALTAEESMLLASGTYGNSPSGMASGGYGGILFDNSGLEAGSQTGSGSAPATAAAPAAAPAAPATTAKSAALPLDRSAALFAGAAVALSAFLL